jgi:hypothetical protein
VKDYTSIDEEDQQNSGGSILRRIAPMPNSKGVLVVEVDKVIRDMKMLYKTIISAKFYRLLISCDEENCNEEDEVDEQRGNNNVVSRYR